MHETRWLNAAWVLLLAATAITYVLGEMGLVSHAGGWVLAGLGVLTVFKGVLVIQVFLEMRHAPALWRWLLRGWLALVIALGALGYLFGRAWGSWTKPLRSHRFAGDFWGAGQISPWVDGLARASLPGGRECGTICASLFSPDGTPP